MTTNSFTTSGALVLFLLGAGSSVRAQTPLPDPVSHEKQTLTDPPRVQVRLPQKRSVGAEEEMINALEATARALRSRRGVTETVPPQTVVLEQTPAGEDLPLPSSAPQESADLPITQPLDNQPLEQSSPFEDPSWFDRHTLTMLPATLLFQPFMANAQQPRMALHLTSLDNSTTSKTIDTAIGGQAGMWRITPTEGGVTFQQDFFGVVLSRFSDLSAFTAADYRFGFPLTFAYKDWHALLSYEHSSTHLGDDFIKNTGQFRQSHIRDEVVVGLDHLFWNKLRIYGQFGHAAYITTPTNSPPDRYGWGLEWSEYVNTGWRGQPFAALDMELRGDQDYTADTTFQIGWQWKDVDNGSSLRTGFEYYHGRSTYGQFYRTDETWYSFSVWIDF